MKAIQLSVLLLLLGTALSAQTSNANNVIVTKNVNNMKEFVFLVRLNPDGVSETEAGDIRSRWTTVLEQWQSRHLFVTSNRVVADGAVVSGKDRKVVKGSLKDGLMVISTINLLAVDLEEVIKLAEMCPILDYGGKVEVREKQPGPSLKPAN